MKNVIGGNAKLLRSINRSMILNIIRTQQPISRVKISKITKLNKSTVSSVVSELLDEEIIVEQKTSDPNVGRNPFDLFLKLGKYFIGAVAIETSILRFAVTDIDGTVIDSSFVEIDKTQGEDLLKICKQSLNKLCKKNKILKLKGIGFSIAGIVDAKSQIVNFASNLGWIEFNIGKSIKKLWPDVEILVVNNDAKSAALAELWFGSYKINLSNFLFLQVGTGIGSGIVVDNKILDGEFHAAGEVGHMMLFGDGEKCICGNNGCWESYASDKSTIKRFLESKKKIPDSVNLKLDDIIKLSENGEKKSVETLKQTGHYLGLGISNIIKIIDPQLIIIGGGIIQAWDIIFPEINKVVRKMMFYGKSEPVPILPTSLTLLPNLLGAAALVIKEVFDDYKITI